VIDFLQLLQIFNAIVPPIVALSILFLSKVSHGELAKWSERQFYTALAVMTVITIRTVIRADDAWLIHTATLGLLVVGSLYVRTEPTSFANLP